MHTIILNEKQGLKKSIMYAEFVIDLWHLCGSIHDITQSRANEIHILHF